MTLIVGGEAINVAQGPEYVNSPRRLNFDDSRPVRKDLDGARPGEEERQPRIVESKVAEDAKDEAELIRANSPLSEPGREPSK